MRQPPATNIIRHTTPTPRNDLPLIRPTKDTKQEKQPQRHAKHDRKRPPVTRNLELDVFKLNAKIPRHEHHRREQNRYLGQQQRHPREPLHTIRFLDGDQVEVHHNQRVLLREAFFDFAQCVQANAVGEPLEAHFGCGAEGYAEEAVGLGYHGPG
jgi:hypothetical protein